MKSELTEPEIITRDGKPVSVILPIQEYEELLERAEDAEDLAWLKKARSKPQSYRTLEGCISQSDLT
ncbi:MAG: type II toxin-antitoxin system Phd/YefM family antitoxin [Verrucomicrobia bacterium]|nr:type II toxin-antitoxin system Phd/YefM family antitoxin [Verrucomicrobiota bacterium]